MITGKLYDRLKFLAQIGLPGAATFYFTIAQIWALAGADKVVGTVVAIDTFLGVLLGISQSNYNKGIEQGGELHVNDGKLTFQLDEDKTDISKLGDKTEVRFKVKNNPGGDQNAGQISP